MGQEEPAGQELRASDSELERVVADLPVERSPAAPPGPARRTFLGIMGGDTLRGPMRLSDRCTIVNVMGGNSIRPSKRRRAAG